MQGRAIGLTIFVSLVIGWGCGEKKGQEHVISETPRSHDVGLSVDQEAHNAVDESFELEACSIARPGDCLRVPDVPTHKEHSVCGYPLRIPVLSYLTCQGTSAVLPLSCTSGAAVTAGGSCVANLALVSAACAVSIATVEQAAECCIKGGCS